MNFGSQTFAIEILTPQSMVYSGQVVSAVFPAQDGLFGVLRGMAPTVAMVGAGPLRFTTADGKARELFVARGFMHVLADVMTVLTEEALSIDEIHPEDVRAELQRAREMPSDTPRALADRQAAMQAAYAKLGLLHKYKKVQSDQAATKPADATA